MKKPKVADLNKIYKDSEECDKEIFADQRSNLLLVAGEHYNRKNVRFWDNIRDSRSLSKDQKVRLTKNHIYKISKIRKNLLLAHSSGVTILPNTESELQDQKAAELNKAVWVYAKHQHDIRKKTQEWAGDFFDIGEVAVKIYFDPKAGRFLGYKQKMSEGGIPEVDVDGNPVPSDEEAVFSGDLVFERIFAFNLLRSPVAKTMKESPYLIVRKVITVDALLEIIGDDEDKREMVSSSKDETYAIFDHSKRDYYKEKGVTTLRELYYRPSPQYPNGYYYIFIESGILWEGELPFGIFPIEYEGHDEVPTTPRHRSVIKQLRPYQIEINRCASKVVEHQITLGDDKLVLINGSKVSKGSDFPGVRTMTVTGQAPIVIGGRSGEQFIPSIEQNIQEMYSIAELPEDLEEKSQGDPWGELFKSARHKKKFIIDCERFESFLVRVCKLYLDLAKNYFDENTIIPMVGKNEQVNISEFKNTSPQCYQIKVEPMSDDLETMMGKQLMLNHILQFSSGQLAREDIGKLIRLMPYANNEKSFDDFTLSYDRATNMILALDRGEAPLPNKYDDGPYMIKRLTARMSQSDFSYLAQQIQTNYMSTVKVYEELEAEKQREMQAAQADFIPTDGPMIKVGWWVKDPTNPSRSVQATLPANAINWLVQRLDDQGSNQEQLMRMNNTGALSDIAQIYNQGNVDQGGAVPQFQGGMI